MSSDELNLLNLPSDIIRLILRANESPHNLGGIRLISQSWNLLAKEYSERLTIVEDCQVYTHPSIKVRFLELHVVLTVKSANAWYVRRYVRDEMKDWRWNEIERGNNGHYEIDVHTLIYRSDEDIIDIIQKHDEKETTFFLSIFSPFRRIRRLYLYCNQNRYLNIFKMGLHAKLVIDCPCFLVDDFNCWMQTFFRDLLNKHRSREIRIYVKSMAEKPTGEFLLNISTRISTAYIEDQGAPKDPEQLFGVPKTCWEAIAQEMI